MSKQPFTHYLDFHCTLTLALEKEGEEGGCKKVTRRGVKTSVRSELHPPTPLKTDLPFVASIP